MAEILIEVRHKDETYGEDLGARPSIREEFAKRSNEIADSVIDVANQFRARLDRAVESDTSRGWAFDRVELSFGLDVEAETGVLIAKAKAGCTFTAMLSWSRGDAGR